MIKAPLCETITVGTVVWEIYTYTTQIYISGLVAFSQHPCRRTGRCRITKCGLRVPNRERGGRSSKLLRYPHTHAREEGTHISGWGSE